MLAKDAAVTDLMESLLGPKIIKDESYLSILNYSTVNSLHYLTSKCGWGANTGEIGAII